MKNPLLETWCTPFGTPPFGIIETHHFVPAIEHYISEALAVINSIAINPDLPTFKNTVEALENTGKELNSVISVMFSLNSAETSKELQAAVQTISQVITRFSNDITLNSKLFERVNAVYHSEESAGLNREQMMLLEKTYRNFLLGGASLKADEKERFRSISEELSVLTVKFEENILDDTNAFALHITTEAELKGLPETVVEMAKEEAVKRELLGWVFTLDFPSYIPFMKYSSVRNLREKMYRAYSSRAFHGDKSDNKENALRIAGLRLELAKLLGFKNYAELVLGDRMAENPANVEKFLKQLFEAARPAALRDFDEVRKFAESKGFTESFERWDWAFYAEMLQKEKYEIDDEVLKPYFELDRVEKAVLGLANSLYGINFEQVTDIPLYHPDVKTWKVTDEDGKFLAVFYADYFPRTGKMGGAWMTSFRDQRIEKDGDVRPLISIVTNFPAPGPGRPSLLTFNDVTTFLHEFGHALHGIFSKCTYESLAGTSVARDFVELPSQFMENYAYEKEWLRSWAKHYQTNETISEELISRIKNSSTYNEGYACNRQLSFGFLDMAWHTLESSEKLDIERFEGTALSKTELFPVVKGTNVSTSFAHIFGGGYAAGYYGYKWAEVLDADAFSMFRQNGLFNRDIAVKFRKNILEKGGTDKPAHLYRQFRGQEPSLDPFLERSGLKISGAL